MRAPLLLLRGVGRDRRELHWLLRELASLLRAPLSCARVGEDSERAGFVVEGGAFRASQVAQLEVCEGVGAVAKLDRLVVVCAPGLLEVLVLLPHQKAHD